MGTVLLVADHFVQKGHYPTRDDWESYVVNNWYPPGEMGCTPSSVGGKKRLVDSTGAPVIYDYVSATEVYVYAEASRSRAGGIYHLENGELNRVSEIPRRLASHRHPFPRRAQLLGPQLLGQAQSPSCLDRHNPDPAAWTGTIPELLGQAHSNRNRLIISLDLQ